MMGIVASNLVPTKPTAEYFVWAVPLCVCLICFDIVFHGPLARLNDRFGQVWAGIFRVVFSGLQARLRQIAARA
jgi:hypothetical protein